MNLITKLAYNALTKTIQAIAPGGVSIAIASAFGKTDGAAIAAGFIGEQQATVPTAQTASGYNSAIACASETLAAGIWLVTATASGANGTRPTGTGITSLGWDLFNGTSSTILVSQKFVAFWHNTANTSDAAYGVGAIACLVILSAPATIQLRVRCDEAAAGTGTPTASSFSGGRFQAVRIA